MSDVEFDEEKIEVPKLANRKVEAMAKWLVVHKIAKNTEQANLLLVIFSILAFTLSMLLMYFGAFYVTPKGNQSTLITPKTNNR
jgi:hypothetical protein